MNGYYYNNGKVVFSDHLKSIGIKSGEAPSYGSPLVYVHPADEDWIILQYYYSNYIKEGESIPKINECLFNGVRFGGRYEGYLEGTGKTYPFEQQVTLGEVVDLQTPVAFTEMDKSFQSAITFDIEGYPYLFTQPFYLFERRGDIYLTEGWLYEQPSEYKAYRVKDEYQYFIKNGIMSMEE